MTKRIILLPGDWRHAPGKRPTHLYLDARDGKGRANPLALPGCMARLPWNKTVPVRPMYDSDRHRACDDCLIAGIRYGTSLESKVTR